MPHRIADADELKKVLASGESETVEFKVTVPPPDVIARNIAAFSNTSGGSVLFGIKDDGSVIGAMSRP